MTAAIIICCIHPGCFQDATNLDLVKCDQHQLHPDAAAFIEDVEWLLETRTPLWTIPRRLGSNSPDAVARRLYRYGRRDLARLFERTQAAA